MSVYHLDRFFSPASIAVFGASEQRGSVGHAVASEPPRRYKGSLTKPLLCKIGYIEKI